MSHFRSLLKEREKRETCFFPPSSFYLLRSLVVAKVGCCGKVLRLSGTASTQGGHLEAGLPSKGVGAPRVGGAACAWSRRSRPFRGEPCPHYQMYGDLCGGGRKTVGGGGGGGEGGGGVILQTTTLRSSLHRASYRLLLSARKFHTPTPTPLGARSAPSNFWGILRI